MFDTLETRVIFRFTRFLALGVVLLLIAGIAIGAVTVFQKLASSPSLQVDPQEVIRSLQPSKSAPVNSHSQPKASSVTNILNGLSLPTTLKGLFSERSNLQLLAGILEDIPQEQRQAYLDNMEDVAVAAKNQQMDIAEAVNIYIRMKRVKLSTAAAHREAVSQYQIYAAASAASALLLVGMFSLVLVLLAIERNTRPSA